MARPGDLVHVIKLPRYWGAADLRGSVGLIIGAATVDESGQISRSVGDGRWYAILIDSKRWTLPTECLEVLSEAR
jgi:hypothetical protein